MGMSMTLPILLVFFGGALCSYYSCKPEDTSPTAKFYERIQYIPIALYQCYRNGSFVEASQVIITTGLWDGTLKDTECALNTIWEIKNGTAKSSTKTNFDTCYNTRSKYGMLTINGSLHETFTILQEPYKGMAYFVTFGKERPGESPSLVYKIYDRIETCVNADELLAMVCPDGCGMVSTKLNIAP